MTKEKIAVLIPCYNEEITIKKVIIDFKKALPEAAIYVYNNNSTDKTKEIALKEKAIVRDEYLQGKGNVVRSMFRDIDADVYVLVDGDDTYPAEEVEKLINPVLEGRADMVIGDRLSSTYFTENKRPFHNVGNKLVRSLINHLFKSNVNDIMTGYRAFSKRFVKCMPVISKGFQIETEMTIFSLVHNMNIVEIPITYRDRPEGSESKLDTYGDGTKVLMTLFNLFKDNRPFLLFGTISIVLFIFGLIVGVPVIKEFVDYRFITKVPSAILAVGLILNSFILFAVGLIMDLIKNKTNFLYESQMNQIIDRLNKKGE